MNRWEADDKPRADGTLVIYQTLDGSDVADVLTTPQDARLMAAAPELAEAVRALLGATDRVCVTHGDAARDALRRTL